jgi:hypothetical protein
MALRSTQPLTEMSTRNLPGGKWWPARKADVTAICETVVWKVWALRRLTILWASTACYRESFTFLHIIVVGTGEGRSGFKVLVRKSEGRKTYAWNGG